MLWSANGIFGFLRWSGNFPRPAELHRPCHYVLLLRSFCHGTRLPEVPVVEKVHDHHPAGKLAFHKLIYQMPFCCQNPGFWRGNSELVLTWPFCLCQVQFVMVTAHIGQFFFMKDCPYQFPVFLYIIGLYGLIFLLLFLHFYYHAYTKGKRLPKVLQNGNYLLKKSDWSFPWPT